MSFVHQKNKKHSLLGGIFILKIDLESTFFICFSSALGNFVSSISSRPAGKLSPKEY